MINEGKSDGMGRGMDTYIVYKFIKLVSSPWKNWEAYRLGIIDDEGTILKKRRKSTEEKNNFTLFHRLTRNIKRLIEKMPGGKTKIGKAVAAYFLLREELIRMGSNKKQINEVFMKYLKEESEPEVVLMMESAIDNDFGITFEDAITTADIAIVPTPMVSDPDGKAMGMYYYTCSTDVYNKCMKGKRKTGRWQQYLEGDERAEGIKNWAKLNAKSGIMIQDKTTGAYTVLRRPAGNKRWAPHY
jgi:hypothetical protein